jgi:UDP-3-O-[3-hydroxymyristoyl] glucosamine N-acyltransferase
MPHFSLAEIADRIGGVVEGGDAELRISGVKSLEEAREGDITLVTTRAHVSVLERTCASAAVAPAGLRLADRPIVRVAEPRLAFARLLEMFHCSQERHVTGVDPRAFIDPSARIGRQVSIAAGAYVAHDVEIGDRVDIYPGVYLGDGVRVGDDCILFANVTIYPGTVIGKRVRIHGGVVLGSDGFGYARGPSGEHYKIPQVGGVEIGDDVEIGANTAVDRATLSVTRIGKGTKIDNLVQIAHNVTVGEHVCIVAQSGIAGSSRIGDRAVLAAAAGVIDHVSVGEGAQVAAQAGVTKDVAPWTSVGGTPAIPLHQAVRAYSMIQMLPEFRRKLKELEERCARIEAELNDRGERNS